MSNRLQVDKRPLGASGTTAREFGDAAAAPASSSHGIVSGIALGVLAAAIWGLLQASARAAVAQNLSPFDLAALRYGIAGGLLAPWLARHGVARPSGLGWDRALLLALLLGPLFFMANVGGYHFAPLAHGAVIFPAAFTVAATALAFATFGEHVSRFRVAGICLIVAGLATISGPSLFRAEGSVALGDAMFVLASVMWAVAATLVRRWGASPMQTTANVAVLSATIYLPLYLLIGTPRHMVDARIGELVMQGLVQGVLVGILAVLAFTRSVEIPGPGRAAVYPALIPLFGIILGVPLTGERPTSLQLAGLAVVTCGLLISNIAGSAKPAA